MRHTYFATIEFGGKVHEWVDTAVSPVAALNHFHYRAQLKQDTDYNRKPTRKRLRPDEYKITRLYIKHDDRDKELSRGVPLTIEEDFDLPRSKNPDLKAPAPTAAVTDEFTGMPNAGEGRLAL